MSRRVVITGDDFGKSSQNNAGLLKAHLDGVLSTTCLMVGGDAVEEALDIARRHQTLTVGLHISFSDTKPIMPPEQVGLLVQSDGRFPPDDRAHKKALLSRRGRQQIAAELAAQCRAFQATGLAWDHINTHRHVHRHPVMAWMLWREAARWPVTVTRIPWDPPVDPLRRLRDQYLRWVGRTHGLAAPDWSIGRNWSADRLVDLLENLRAGTTEIYFHPGDPLFPADLPTLLDTNVRMSMQKLDQRQGLRVAFGNILSNNR